MPYTSFQLDLITNDRISRYVVSMFIDFILFILLFSFVPNMINNDTHREYLNILFSESDYYNGQ